MDIPKGFIFSGINSGVREQRNDLGLIMGEDILDAVCYFTDNSFKAAPLLLSIEAIEETNSQIKAIVVNSGNANCATGQQGIDDALKICNQFSEMIETDGNLVHSSSTGIIGKRMAIKKITSAFDQLIQSSGKTDKELNDFSDAILTTDLVSKIISKRVKIGSEFVTICGVAKGSGMIQPQMSLHATMLSYIMTDAKISKSLFKTVTKKCIDSSFNTITVDGCSSTNDSVFFLSSQKSKVKIDKKHKDFAKFEKALNDLCFELAEKIVIDGEGASKCITVTVKGAKNQQQAKDAAMVICNSVLFKTAMYGENPNIGRITQILGQFGFVDSSWEPSIKLKGLKSKKVDVTVDIAQGKAEWSALTCDLTEDYIKINAEYN